MGQGKRSQRRTGVQNQKNQQYAGELSEVQNQLDQHNMHLAETAETIKKYLSRYAKRAGRSQI